MKPKHTDIKGDHLFYCFVDMGKTFEDQPQIYILPSDVVADVIKTTHQYWLAKPGKNGQAHKDSNVRRLLPDYSRLYGSDKTKYGTGWLEKYKNAWNLLNLEPASPDTETAETA